MEGLSGKRKHRSLARGRNLLCCRCALTAKLHAPRPHRLRDILQRLRTHTRGSGVSAAVYSGSATGAKRGSPSLALDAALVHTSQILIMSGRPLRCRRAEANSPTLELTSRADGPWFDLVITQWYPTVGRIGSPSRWSQRLAWSQR